MLISWVLLATTAAVTAGVSRPGLRPGTLGVRVTGLPEEPDRDDRDADGCAPVDVAVLADLRDARAGDALESDAALAEVLAGDAPPVSACAVGIAIAVPTPRKTANAPTLPTNLAYPAAGRNGSLWVGERITPPAVM